MDSIDYWKWLFKGRAGGKSGLTKFIDIWLIVHVLIGLLLTLLLTSNLKDAANTVLLPLAGIFVGLSFAWAGNAQALLQSEEIEKLSENSEGGFQNYVFTFQTAILVILIDLIFWGLAGLELFDKRWPTNKSILWYSGIKTFLYFLSSLTIRECWHVVMGAQWMLLVQHQIKKKNKK